jgi:hypothetical protein
MIKEENFYCFHFSINKEMYVEIDKVLNLNEVIRLRNFLTSEIERIQTPIKEMLDKVNGNASPDLNGKL